ncbi:hypothetical protein [Bradyrhizobium sp. 1]|uniref:hypothetical protein n=1 Tax=Bradyrhizobium sp. 1 TaxID=241591 RepID=UPI001FFA096C|nr:hypothetical protein [Bradyrhizobium sp. 1]MCK1396404.1 hypothetical protein [Bradyrhizobium sp. 1]
MAEPTFIDWLNSLQGGAATFIGAATGSVIGFGALVAGALFNAKLNRDRDDRLRKVERRSVAAALRAELESVRNTLMSNAERLRNEPPKNAESFFVPDLSHSVRMFPDLSDKLGLLEDPSIIMEIIQTAATCSQAAAS